MDCFEPEFSENFQFVDLMVTFLQEKEDEDIAVEFNDNTLGELVPDWEFEQFVNEVDVLDE